MKFMSALLLAATSLITVTSYASENRGDAREQLEPRGFLYGVGIAINQEVYNGYDRRVVPLPILGYRGERLSILGPFISYDVVQQDGLRLAVQAAPRFQSFDSSDSDIFVGMDEREFSFDAGLGLKYQRDDWNINVSSMFDAMNKSNGYELRSSIGRAFNKGPIFIEPSLSLSYLDANNVNYYYGVAAAEANAFRPAYEGKSAVNSSLGLSISTPILFGGFTSVNLNYTWNDSSISESPLVLRDTSFSLMLIYSRFF